MPRVDRYFIRALYGISHIVATQPLNKSKKGFMRHERGRAPFFWQGRPDNNCYEASGPHN